MTKDEFFTSHSLDLLSSIWARGGEKLRNIVADRISKQCHFELPEDLNDLTEEQLTKLHEFEDENQPWLLKQLLGADDSRETKIISSSNRSAVWVYWFGVALAMASITYVFLITWIPIPPENIRFADTALGFILGSLLATVINFFFGSSMQRTDFHSFTDTTTKRANLPRFHATMRPPGADDSEDCRAYPDTGALNSSSSSATSSVRRSSVRRPASAPRTRREFSSAPELDSRTSELDEVKPNIPGRAIPRNDDF